MNELDQEYSLLRLGENDIAFGSALNICHQDNSHQI